MESELIKKFYQGFWLYLVAIIVFLIILIIFLIMKNKFLTKFNNAIIKNIIFYLILFSSITIGAFFSIKLSYYLKDLNAVQTNNFEIITGTVIDYGKAKGIGDLATETKYYFPIIKDIESGEKIKINCNNTKLNETYTFIFLKNTRLAVIKND